MWTYSGNFPCHLLLQVHAADLPIGQQITTWYAATCPLFLTHIATARNSLHKADEARNTQNIDMLSCTAFPGFFLGLLLISIRPVENPLILKSLPHQDWRKGGMVVQL